VIARGPVLVVAALVAVATARVDAQAPANDTCAAAVPIAEGAVVLSSNALATIGPDPLACNGGSDVWYSFVPNCSAQYLASTCAAGTSFDTVLSVWSAVAGCGALTLVSCSDNNCPLAGSAPASRISFTAMAGAVYFVSVGGKFGATGAFSLQVTMTPVMTLAFFNAGPGTLGYHVTGPSNGVFFAAITLNAGAFPFGWFYGIDMPLFDILYQFNFGPPFVGSFSACGTATVGPAVGLPPGLSVYAVALGFVAGAQTPGFFSNPTVGTVP
jgi:hypothetical protein